jgi:hypothetical protein
VAVVKRNLRLAETRRNRLRRNGKEGVDGSSPLEGFAVRERVSGGQRRPWRRERRSSGSVLLVREARFDVVPCESPM